jgi:hypothetical protein
MKLTSLFSHFPAFHPHADERTSHSAGGTAVTRGGEPTFVFRGHPCQKGQPEINPGIQPPHRVFRGIAYSRAVVLSGLDIPEQKGVVRVFRGRVVRRG